MTVAAAAVALGSLTGAFVLPDRTARPDVGDVGPTVKSAAPTSTPGPTPTETAGPVDASNLVPVSAFRQTGFDVTPTRRGRADPTAAVSWCTERAAEDRRTVADLTTRRPTVLGVWTEAGEKATAGEVLVDAPSPELAARSVRDLVTTHTRCETEPAGQRVYGPVEIAELGPLVSASWFGMYAGDLNTAGRAPRGLEPCGGIAFVANGSRFAVLDVYLCADSEQLGQLARAAARALA